MKCYTMLIIVFFMLSCKAPNTQNSTNIYVRYFEESDEGVSNYFAKIVRDSADNRTETIFTLNSGLSPEFNCVHKYKVHKNRLARYFKKDEETLILSLDSVVSSCNPVIIECRDYLFLRKQNINIGSKDVDAYVFRMENDGGSVAFLEYYDESFNFLMRQYEDTTILKRRIILSNCIPDEFKFAMDSIVNEMISIKSKRMH